MERASGRRFELRRRHPRGGAPSDWVMGFGVWTPDLGQVVVCWLGPPQLRTIGSLDAFVSGLRPEIALVWVDVIEHAATVAIDQWGERS